MSFSCLVFAISAPFLRFIHPIDCNLLRREAFLTMLSLMPKTETELRQAVIDRLIAASVSNGKNAREAALARWRQLALQSTNTDQNPA